MNDKKTLGEVLGLMPRNCFWRRVKMPSEEKKNLGYPYKG